MNERHVPPFLQDLLMEEGLFIPENCVNVKLKFPLDGAAQIEFTQLLTWDDLVKIGRAVKRLGEEGNLANPT